MKIWIKRCAAAALIAAGVILFISHLRQLLNWSHLYPDLGQLRLDNLIFFGLTLLLAAFAWIAAAYLLLNAKERVPRLLIPAAAFVLLLTLSGLCATRAVGEIPCSYTDSLASFREEFDSQSFRVRGKALYPGYAMGELTAYAPPNNRGPQRRLSVGFCVPQALMQTARQRQRRMASIVFHIFMIHSTFPGRSPLDLRLFFVPLPCIQLSGANCCGEKKYFLKAAKNPG